MFETILMGIGIWALIMGVIAVARGAPKGDEFVWGVGAAIVTLLIIFHARFKSFLCCIISFCRFNIP